MNKWILGLFAILLLSTSLTGCANIDKKKFFLYGLQNEGPDPVSPRKIDYQLQLTQREKIAIQLYSGMIGHKEIFEEEKMRRTCIDVCLYWAEEVLYEIRKQRELDEKYYPGIKK